MASIAVTVKINGKDYRISCQDHEKEELVASARLLDDKMQDVKNAGKIVGTERQAVMAALNLSHELLQYRLADKERSRALKSRLQGLQQRIEVALDNQTQLQL